MALTSDDPIATPVAVVNRSVTECDRLAASDQDRARPPEVPGVLWDRIDADAAIPACIKAVEENPRVARYLYNLGRAYQKLGARPGLDEAERGRALRSARLSYDDATKRGYVSALNDLAVLYENGDGVEANNALAIDLLKKAAQQGDPLAMYNLALHYKNGTDDVKRDVAQAAEWFAKSAESGSVSAMVELGDALINGRGQAQNPRRGLEWLQRAADAGSVRAKFLLGMTYWKGRICTCGMARTARTASGRIPISRCSGSVAWPRPATAMHRRSSPASWNAALGCSTRSRKSRNVIGDSPPMGAALRPSSSSPIRIAPRLPAGQAGVW